MSSLHLEMSKHAEEAANKDEDVTSTAAVASSVNLGTVTSSAPNDDNSSSINTTNGVHGEKKDQKIQPQIGAVAAQGGDKISGKKAEMREGLRTAPANPPTSPTIPGTASISRVAMEQKTRGSATRGSATRASRTKMGKTGESTTSVLSLALARPPSIVHAAPTTGDNGVPDKSRREGLALAPGVEEVADISHRSGGNKEDDKSDKIEESYRSSYRSNDYITKQDQDHHNETLINAELVDDDANEVDLDLKSREIREQIINEAVVATAVTESEEEKSFVEKYGIFLCFGLVVIVLAVVLGVVLTRKKEAVVTPATPPPSPSPTNQPTPVSDYEFLLNLFTPISGNEALMTDETPQSKALDWVATMDPLFNRSDTMTTKQRYILAVLYYTTNGDEWAEGMNFLTNTSACQWPPAIEGEFASNGVRCNSEGEVNQIIIEYNNLNGTLPSELSHFTALEDLALRGNLLYGTLPPEYGSLVRLEQLDLARNGFIGGTIPDSLGGLTELRELALHTNSFVGTIPSKIPMLPKVVSFWLNNNFLTGTIPEFLGRSSILSLQLDDNMLDGTLPSSIYSLAAVTRLATHNNPIFGTISPSIALLSNLKSLELNGCSFNGTIPWRVGGLTSLTYIGLGANGFTGTIPSDLGRLIFLERLFLHHNMLTGTIPSEVGMLTNLFTVFLEGNLLTGTVPAELGQLPGLRNGVLVLQNNSLTGSVEQSLCNQTGLPPFFGLTADCDEVDCPCCTECCSDLTGECVKDVASTCLALEFIYEFCEPCMYVFGTECDCIGEEGTILSCADTACQPCNADGTVCVENYDYGYDLPPSGIDHLYRCNMRYTEGLEGDVSWNIDWLTYQCQVALNGEPCDVCGFKTCADRSGGLRVDCTNVDETALFDSCSPLDDGGDYLQVFRDEFLFTDDGCFPCISF